MELIKGAPVRVFDNQVLAKLSEIAVDVRGYNAVNVQVFVSGTNPSATVSVEGGDAEGANTLTLADPSASQTGVTSSKTFDAVVGTSFVRIRLADLSGSYAKGQGFTVIVTPYVSPGQAQISISNTASQNLAQVGGSAVALGQTDKAHSLPVTLASDQTVPVDTELPAAAALADGAANPTTPTEGAAKLAFNGATWDRERIATVFKNIAAQAVTANTPVTVWTPAAGKKFRLLGYALSLSVAGSVILKDNTTEFLRTPLMAAGVGQASPALGNGILSAAANNTLKIDVSASGNVSGYVFGVEE